MKYYKVEVCQMTTDFNNETQDWSGEITDCGVIETIRAKSVSILLDRLKAYGFKEAEQVEDEPNRFELNYEGSDKALIDLSFYFYEVSEAPLNIKKAV